MTDEQAERMIELHREGFTQIAVQLGHLNLQLKKLCVVQVKQLETLKAIAQEIGEVDLNLTAINSNMK